MAVFFYAVLMHGLVFAVLYKLALTDSCRYTIDNRHPPRGIYWGVYISVRYMANYYAGEKI